jgi:hypothetical protein
MVLFTGRSATLFCWSWGHFRFLRLFLWAFRLKNIMFFKTPQLPPARTAVQLQKLAGHEIEGKCRDRGDLPIFGPRVLGPQGPGA